MYPFSNEEYQQRGEQYNLNKIQRYTIPMKGFWSIVQCLFFKKFPKTSGFRSRHASCMLSLNSYLRF